jgi:tripartite-type tricarboxylate transporter receptor subunit TctC
MNLNRIVRTCASASLCAVAALAASTGGAQTQPYPSKPIRMIVAFPAGGGLDAVARIVAQRLSETMKQQIVVENRAGANGAIGADAVAKSAADGYTLLMASPAEVVVGPEAGQKTPYNPQTDLVPVALVGETPLVLITHPSIPAANLTEFIAYAKANPGKLSYGTPGSGSSMHFAGESLRAATGASMVHVPYRGAAPALNDVLGNQIGAAIVGMPPVVAHAKAGRVKVMAVTTAKRSALMPEVAAVSELPNLNGFRFTNWMMVFAPAKTPSGIVDRLSDEIAKMTQDLAIKERLLAAGVEPLGLRGNDVANFLVAERKRYQTVAKEQGVKFEE